MGPICLFLGILFSSFGLLGLTDDNPNARTPKSDRLLFIGVLLGIGLIILSFYAG
jgi:hypothetical protein